jgi:hypothetical protein
MVRFGSLKHGSIWKGRFGVKRRHAVLLLSLFIAFGSVGPRVTLLFLSCSHVLSLYQSS